MYRMKAGLSLRELARRAGCTHTILSRVERGSQHLSPRLLDAYQDILGVTIQGSDVYPSQQVVKLQLAPAFHHDTLRQIRFTWSGKTERNSFRPDLIVDDEILSKWPEPTQFQDAFGLVRPDDGDADATRAARLLNFPDSTTGMYAPFEEMWEARPPIGLSAFQFAIPANTRVAEFEILVKLHGYSRTIIYINGDRVLPFAEARLTRLNLGGLTCQRRYRISWGRMREEDFNRPKALFGVSRERERWAAKSGWIEVEEGVWESASGERRRLEDL